MNRRFQTLLAVVCGTAVIGAGLGCEDADARRRAEVQQQITEAQAQFQRASLSSASPDDEHAQEVRSDLNRIISSLQGVTDGTSGQQAAKSLLMAEALRELSMIEYRHLHEMESDYQLQRQIARNKLVGLRRLAAVRQAREAVSADQHRAELSQIRQITDAQLRQLQQQLAQISEPIAELTDRNERDQARIDELREQAMQMMRRAEELGPADGFETFEEAIRIQREADLIEFRAAHRELELFLEHQPAQALTQRQFQAAEDLKQQVQQAIRDLESFDQLYASAASKLRERIEADGEDLRRRVDRFAASMKDVLAPAYNDAAEHLDRAASQVRQAATRLSGDEAAMARVVEARVHEQLGRLHRRQASGVADHIALLNAIIASSNALGNVQQYQHQIAQFSEQYDTLLAQAKSAYTQAKETLTMVGGAATQQVAPYRQNIETLLAALEGEHVDRLDAQPPSVQMPGVDRPTTPTETPAGEGFDSPEDLVAFLAGLDETSVSDIDRMLAAMHAESPGGRAVKNMLGALMRGSAELLEAVIDQFGMDAARQLEQAAGAGMAGGMGFNNIRLVEQSDTRATATYEEMPGMPEETVELMMIDGQWFIDADSLEESEGDPGMEELTLGMMEQMAMVMSQQLAEMTRRVRNGEFATIEEFMQSMMEMMMQGAGQMEGMDGMPDIPDEFK